MLNTCIDMGRDVLCKRRGSESKEDGIRNTSLPISDTLKEDKHYFPREGSNANKEYHNKRV